MLGSDYRPAHPGNRTDTVMVVSIDPVSGATAVASIPRDTARLPLVDGGVYTPKVNGLYQSLIGRLGRVRAGAEMKRLIGGVLGVEIDAYVVIGFEGVRRLIDAVGGVEVTLARAVRDPYYWVTSRQRGVTFPAGRNQLDGDRALIFARTRMGDNDYERARRQQLLVAAAAAKVLELGPRVLPALLRVGSDWIRTDLPLHDPRRLYDIVASAELDTDRRVVFGPRTWASQIPGTASIELDLAAVRRRIAEWMPPVVPTAADIETEPSPLGPAARAP
jgi:LCP family protein required for cell wall assembly